MWTLYQGDALQILKQVESGSVHCCVTSPPYWGLRDYGVEPSSWPVVTYSPMAGLPEIEIPEMECCLGLEKTPEAYIGHIILIFREVCRVLRKDGTSWLNLGDSYAKEGLSGMGDPTVGERNLGGMKPISKKIPHGLKPKDIVGIPWRVAFALQADGWYLRSDIIWSKPNPMPESVMDRPTKSHEYIFLLAKSERYYYDHEAIKEPSTYLQPNSPESIKSPYGQGYTRRANTGVGFGYGTDKEKRSRDRVRGSKGVINNPLNSALRKSGNKERKINAPQRLNTHMGSSVPWEGLTRNKRTVWTVSTKPFNEAHFATFPPYLIVPCILAGCPEGGTAIDPFTGSGTMLWVAEQLGRNSIGVEIKPEYCDMTRRRMASIEPSLFEGVTL